jgi:hypothetical protein
VPRRHVLDSTEDGTSGSSLQESTLTRIVSTIRMLALFDRETVGSIKDRQQATTNGMQRECTKIRPR